MKDTCRLSRQIALKQSAVHVRPICIGFEITDKILGEETKEELAGEIEEIVDREGERFWRLICKAL